MEAADRGAGEAPIDLSDALRRLGGKRAVVMKLLEAFVRNQADFDERLGALLAASNVADAERLSHSLKGAAGNVGAKGLHVLATELDRELRSPNPDLGVVDGKRRASRDELARVLAHAKSLLAEEAAPSSPVTGAPPRSGEIGAARELLAEKLRAADFDAGEAFAKFRELARAAFDSAALDRIGGHVDRMEHEAALVALQEITPPKESPHE